MFVKFFSDSDDDAIESKKRCDTAQHSAAEHVNMKHTVPSCSPTTAVVAVDNGSLNEQCADMADAVRPVDNWQELNCLPSTEDALSVNEPDIIVIAHQLYDESDVSDDEQGHFVNDLPFSVNDHVDPCTSSECILQQSNAAVSPPDLMLLLIKLKHNLTKEAIEDIAKLLNVVSNTAVASSSIHSILKDFVTGKNNVEVHHVCKQCSSYVGVVTLDEITCPLSSCSFKIRLQDSLEGGHFFFYLPLGPQLTDLFENHGLLDVLRRPSVRTFNNNICDIVSGKLYKQIYGQLSSCDADYHLTLTFNCDGVPVFKSSSFGIWPILCAVNELPPDIKSNHILMAALWFGVGKPDMNVFLEPFINDCISLSEKGFSSTLPGSHIRISCKANAIVGICDAVARPLMQNFKQFNGHYGCGYCLHEGERVEQGNGWTMAYPKNSELIMRCKEGNAALVSEAMDTGTPCMGVKGPSLLSLLPHFDIIKGMVPDYMHCICLGVVRQMAKLWFHSKHHEQPFYIGTLAPVIDSRLLAIKPPCSISRTPRSVSVLKFWKAHEWLAWLLYYSLPVLKNILPAAYYNHWALLVECTAVLLGNDITLANLVHCERSIVQFVSDFQDLYGKQHMSFNVHQTLHIVQSVKDWGPLWSHSAFMFEAFNAVLLKMIRGTQGVPMQILNTFYLTRAIPHNIRNVLPNCSHSEKLFIETLTTHRRKIKAAMNVTNGVIVLGQPSYRLLRRSHFVALHSVSVVVPQTIVAYYNRVINRGEIIHTYKYCKDLKRNSYTVHVVDGNYFQVEKYLVTDLGNGDNCYALGRYLRRVPFQFCSRDLSLKLNHIVPVSKVPSALVAIHVSDIVGKCVFVSASHCDVNFVCKVLHLLDSCA